MVLIFSFRFMFYSFCFLIFVDGSLVLCLVILFFDVVGVSKYMVKLEKTDGIAIFLKHDLFDDSVHIL